jgi:O-antigen ligase
MPTDLVQDTKFKWIMYSLFFLFTGFLSSPTIVSAYHILIIIPALLIFKEGGRVQIPKSGYILIALAVWGIICNSVNFDELIKVRKSYDELKFYLAGPLLILPLRYFFSRASKFQIKRLLNILCVVITMAFIVGISKMLFSFDLVKMEYGKFLARSYGFTNYMRYGYASGLLFVLGLGFFFNKRKLSSYISPKLFYIALTLSFCAVFAAKTRGALLGIIVGVVVLCWKYNRKLSKIAVAIGFVLVSTMVLLSALKVDLGIRMLRLNGSSNRIRMSQFATAVKSIEEKPIFGVGASQFAYHVPRLKKKYDIWSKDYQGHSHNIFLEHATNYGIFGLLLFIAFLVMWSLELLRIGELGWVLLSYLIAFVVSGQVENLFDNTNSHLLFFIYTISHIKFSEMDNLKGIT